MRELERDQLVDARPLGLLHLVAELPPVERRELDGHVPAERLDGAPALDAVAPGQFGVGGEKLRQLVVGDLPVLKRDDVDPALEPRERGVPLADVLLDRDRGVAELLDAADVGRDENREGLERAEVVGELLVDAHHAVVAHVDLVAEVPALEGRAVAVALHDLIQKRPVEVGLGPVLARDPVAPRVV